MPRHAPHAAHPDLQADCGNCFALCCVALPFARSADFAVNKAVGTPCGNLQDDFRCKIHERLRDSGYNGCVVFDCFGAGQKVSQVTFKGHSWRDEPASARTMYEVFPVMRQLHELLRYTAEAMDLTAAQPIATDLRRAYDRIDTLTRGTPEALLAVDVPALRSEVNALLLRASELARAKVPGRKKNHRGADLTGARLRGAKLRGVSLRGAYLIGANLSDAGLRTADFIGTDLRGANLCGTDLTDALFLTQPQLNAARGNRATRIPATLQRPDHWTAWPSRSTATR